jgi:hypothetical protein
VTGDVRVFWTRVPEVYRYSIICSTDPPEEVATVITAVLFRDLTPGTTYIFTVIAERRDGSVISIGFSAPYTVA